MSSAELKSDLHNYIDRISDSTILKAIHVLLKKQFSDTIAGYEPNGKAITKKVFLKRIATAEKQYSKGQYIDINELERESETW